MSLWIFGTSLYFISWRTTRVHPRCLVGSCCSIIRLQYFVDLCLFLFLFFIWPFCCMSFNLRILIAPLVSSNFSYWWKKPEYPEKTTDMLQVTNVCQWNWLPLYQWNIVESAVRYHNHKLPLFDIYHGYLKS